MIVLVGEGTGPKWEAKLQPLGWGRMFTSRKPTPYEGEPWGWDSGAFIAWKRGTTLDEDKVWRRFDRDLWAAPPPLLAIVPDLVAQGLKSLEYSVAWSKTLKAKGSDWPWYLAVQDGMAPRDVQRELWRFDGVFLGGTKAFKATAPKWRKLASSLDLPFHYGRAGTINAMYHALECNADSCDSAFPMWTRQRFAEFAHHVSHRPRFSLGLAV